MNIVLCQKYRNIDDSFILDVAPPVSSHTESMPIQQRKTQPGIQEIADVLNEINDVCYLPSVSVSSELILGHRLSCKEWRTRSVLAGQA